MPAILIKLHFEYYAIDPDKGIEFAKKGIELSEKHNFKKELAKNYNGLADLLITPSRYNF